MLQATVWATSSVSRLRTWRRARVWKLQAFAMFLAWQSNRRLESMVTPSDLSFDATGRVLPATSTVVMLVADRSWAGVPRRTTSDLSALSWRPFCRNQRRTAAEQWASLSISGVALVLTVICALIVSKLDYCCSVLAGVSETLQRRLQSVFNAAAQLVLTELALFLDH